MATRTKKKQSKSAAIPEGVLAPQDVHAMFGVPGPYELAKPPIPTKGYVTFWDVGMSIHEMRRRNPKLFSNPSALEGQAFAKLSDSWKFRQIDLTPSGLNEPMDPKAHDLPLARELVCYLVLHFLSKGEKIEIPRLRCRDVMPSGRRVCVGPWHDCGLEICNVSDDWSGSRMGYCSLYTPVMPKRK